MLDSVIQTIRAATRESPFAGKLFLVGGLLRDRALGLTPDEDVDIVCLADALQAAEFLHGNGVTGHAPVVYPRFGTAMVSVRGVPVEFATARRESYSPGSRKPAVEPATLEEDVTRRDFTVNTLLENLHTGEQLDLTGRARADMAARLIRTPLDPEATFRDDPLRLLRAVRFAAKLSFEIEPETHRAIVACVPRLSIVSSERIRDDFTKTLMLPRASYGLELLRQTGLLGIFAPELAAMHGVEQNMFHIYDVWGHTLKALESLPPDAGPEVRLAVLFHDIGKPRTKSVGEDGCAHFYGHQAAGAEMTRRILHRLKFPNAQIERVCQLVGLHMRIGEYTGQWSDTAVRRLIRDFGDNLDDLFTISHADRAACNPEFNMLDPETVRERVELVRSEADYAGAQSPLDGLEIMAIAGISAGPEVGRYKAMLVEEILEGRLAPGDKEAAEKILRRALKDEHAS